MDTEIQDLRDHYIVCGGGETGVPLVEELIKNNEQVVLIEYDEEKLQKYKPLPGLCCLNGDATDDQNLLAAGIDHAAGIIICLPSDKDTLYVTMTARILNKRIRIISRMVDPKLEPKLKKAGANGVVSPNFIGALRMASEMIRPAVVAFLDSMLRSSQGKLGIHPIVVTADSPVAGKRIDASGLIDEFGLLVLGAKHPAKELEFNPNSDELLRAGMTLIVMGDIDNIARAKKVFESDRPNRI